MTVHGRRAALLYGVAVVGLPASLSACGGGGAPEAAPMVPSARVFQLRVAQLAMSSTVFSSPITVTGTLNNAAVTGSGTATAAAVQAALFEGRNALKRLSTLTLSLLMDGQTVPLVLQTSSYFDSNYQLLGISGSDYRVIEASQMLPVTAKVNEGGVAFTASRYASSSKTDLLGTVESRWALLPDTDTTAILRITDSAKDVHGNLAAQSVATYRVTPFGGVTRIGESILDLVSPTNLIVSY